MRLGGRYICHTSGCLVGHVSKVAPGLSDACGVRLPYVLVNAEWRREGCTLGCKPSSDIGKRHHSKVGAVQARSGIEVRTPCEPYRWRGSCATSCKGEADVVGACRYAVSDVNGIGLSVRSDDFPVVGVGNAYYARLLHEPNGGNVEPYFGEIGVVKVKYERPCRNPVNVRACGAKRPERAHSVAPEGIPRNGDGVLASVLVGFSPAKVQTNFDAKKERQYTDASERHGVVGGHFDRSADVRDDHRADDDRDGLEQVCKHLVNNHVQESLWHLLSNR